jgi:hypothetical protein
LYRALYSEIAIRDTVIWYKDKHGDSLPISDTNPGSRIVSLVKALSQKPYLVQFIRKLEVWPVIDRIMLPLEYAPQCLLEEGFIHRESMLWLKESLVLVYLLTILSELRVLDIQLLRHLRFPTDPLPILDQGDYILPHLFAGAPRLPAAAPFSLPGLNKLKELTIWSGDFDLCWCSLPLLQKLHLGREVYFEGPVKDVQPLPTIKDLSIDLETVAFVSRWGLDRHKAFVSALPNLKVPKITLFVIAGRYPKTYWHYPQMFVPYVRGSLQALSLAQGNVTADDHTHESISCLSDLSYYPALRTLHTLELPEIALLGSQYPCRFFSFPSGVPTRYPKGWAHADIFIGTLLPPDLKCLHLWNPTAGIIEWFDGLLGVISNFPELSEILFSFDTRYANPQTFWDDLNCSPVFPRLQDAGIRFSSGQC